MFELSSYLAEKPTVSSFISLGGGFPDFGPGNPLGGFRILTWEPPGGVPGGFPDGQHCWSKRYAIEFGKPKTTFFALFLEFVL